MSLLVVRLFRPPAAGDFWMLQGLGLLQVALGCVLASSMLFGVCLVVYLFVAGCAVACHERHVQGRPVPGVVAEHRGELADGTASLPAENRPTPGRSGWLVFGLRWAPAVIVLVGTLYLLTPRVEGPEWDPLARFGVQAPKMRMQTGFSDEIDLTRIGRLENDTSPAFTVHVENRDGKPVRGLLENQRFRGLVFDHYDYGKWRVSHTLRGYKHAPPAEPAPLVFERADLLFLRFRVPQEAGGLFLAEPAMPGPEVGKLPVALEDAGSRKRVPFFEPAGTGTIVPMSYLLEPETRYVQSFLIGAGRDRYPAVRLDNTYLMQLIGIRRFELVTWAIELVQRMDRQIFPEAERLLPQMERLREQGASLAPGYYEPVAQLFSRYFSHSGEYTWSLDVRRQDRNLDPVLDFLTHVKEGPCDRFASSLALLLRAFKIPARLVRGFRGAEYQGDGNYSVFNNYAHAWVEAIVPSQSGSGWDWLILDPSPPEAIPSTTALLRLQRSSQALWRDLFLGYAEGEGFNLWDDLISGRLFSYLAPWLGLIVVLAGLWWVVRRRRGRRVSGGKPGSLYERMLNLLGRVLQLRPGPGETPVELAERAAELLADRPATAAMADVPVQVVALYYSVRYGGRTPDETAVREASGRLDALAQALRRGE
jgi:transglutaminase-like putative cysteine protease